MVSIVICSVNPSELLDAKENISKTIGVEHEIIAVENMQTGRGICSVYNEAAERARYDIICFMHEDILMLTPNWGRKVMEIFSDNPALGLLGIAGGGYKSLAPSSWYNYHLQQNGGFYCSLIQGFKHTGKEDLLTYRNPKNERLSKVACVDGCWFCTTRKVFREFGFDEKLLPGFHGYDLDFSISVGQKYEVGVTFEILMKHLSEGNFDEKWLAEIIKVHKKWAAVLPINIDRIQEKELKKIERHAFEIFISENLSKKTFGKIYLINLLLSTRKSRVTTFSFIYKLVLRVVKY